MVNLNYIRRYHPLFWFVNKSNLLLTDAVSAKSKLGSKPMVRGCLIWFQPISVFFKKPCDALNNFKICVDPGLRSTRFSRRLWTLPQQESGMWARQYCPRMSRKSRPQALGVPRNNVLFKKIRSSDGLI